MKEFWKKLPKVESKKTLFRTLDYSREDNYLKRFNKIINLDKPIEELGIFEVSVKLHPEVNCKIRLWVTKK